MRVKIANSDLKNLLKKVVNFVEPKGVIPILSNFLINVRGDKIIIEGTDISHHLRIEGSANVEQEGVVCVNARSLFNIVKVLPEKDVSISLDESILKVEAGKSKFKLPVINDIEDFPTMEEFPEDDKTVVSGEILKKALSKTKHAVSKEESKYAIQGILIKSTESGLDFVATDGHRLALYKADTIIGKEISAIITEKTARELINLLTGYEDVEMAISVSGAYMMFRTPEWVLMGRLIEGNFPNYTMVFPEEDAYTLIAKVDRSEFIRVIRRVTAISDEDVKQIKIEVNPESNTMSILGYDKENGNAEDEIALKSVEGKSAISIGFNGRYIVELLTAIDEEDVLIRFTNENAQTLFYPEEESFSAIVMPMTIS